MTDIAKVFSEKRYDDFRRTIISDCMEIILNTIANQTSLDNKDKSFTAKKLNSTVELIYELLGKLSNDQFPSDIIKTLKPKIPSRLNNTFCFKQPVKKTTSKEDFSDIPVIFSPYVQSAVEIPYKELKSSNVKLTKNHTQYHFFTLAVTIDKKKYIVNYAEENKYSKREIIEVLSDNEIVDKSIVSSELKTKYGFI